MSPEVDLQKLAVDRGVAAGPKRHRRRHLLTRYVLPGLLLLGFLALLAWASRELVFPPRSVNVVPVLATHASVQRAGTPLFKAAGWIEPRPTPIRVAALAPGVVENLLVVEDQPVKAGDPIAELVKEDARLAHNKALADLKLRQAELEQAKAALIAATTRFKQPVHLEAALGEAEAALAKTATQLKNLPFELRRAEARLEFAEKDYEGKNAAKGAVAGRIIDAAKSEMDAAEALVHELRDRASSLASEKAALTGRRNALQTRLELLADETELKDEAAAKLDAAEARVEQANVAASESKLRLDRMTVRAPIDGRVFRLIGHPGARIGSGMTQMQGHDGSTVVTLYRPDMLQVRVDVRFEDIPKVRLKQPVQIENPALESTLNGVVLFVSSEADIQKNTLQVKVAIESPPPVLKPEMLVDVTFLAPKHQQHDSEPTQELRLHVPQQLVLQDEAGKFVWVADQSERVARKTPVKTGLVGGDGMTEILDGLTISSRIIAGEYQGLLDGDRIKVARESASQ